MLGARVINVRPYLGIYFRINRTDMVVLFLTQKRLNRRFWPRNIFFSFKKKYFKSSYKRDFFTVLSKNLKFFMQKQN